MAHEGRDRTYCGRSRHESLRWDDAQDRRSVDDREVIEVEALTKRYGAQVAVDDLSFTVRPGIVTAFLGPNGAGKSTTMRLILGLDRPTAGSALVNGKPLAQHAAPLREIGSLLDARAVHPKRSARAHLTALAQTTGLPTRRVDEVIGLVGLDGAADRPAGSFSLGMGQRLGIASALLGDPATVMLDEPVNGLDPEGILWIRGLLQDLAAEGRTVFVSSHLISEMAMIADHYVVIGRGRLLADVPADQLAARAEQRSLRVRSPHMDRLTSELAGIGVTATATGRDTATITDATAELVGETAAAAGVVLFELTPQQQSLEDVFMDLTRDAVDYHARSAQEAIR